MSAKTLAFNPVQHARSKHIKLDIHFVCGKVLAGQLDVQYVPSTEQMANGFTKPLAYPQFFNFLNKLGMVVSASHLRGNVKTN